MRFRPLCKVCNTQPAAVNYVNEGVRHFRSLCGKCLRKKANAKPAVPPWKTSGYRKAKKCEKCGFNPRYACQLFVYHIDGDLTNVSRSNLKTICSNCQIEVAEAGLGWVQGDLTPDF